MKQKILTTTFCLLVMASSTLGQKSAISLSFTGTINGQYAQLSKIDIRNLDRNCDTILYWPDTVLNLIPVGINDLHSLSEEFQVFQNVPNPVNETTKIMLYIPESGNVKIEISLLTGSQIAFFSQELKRGYHSFSFTPGGAAVYIFTAHFKSTEKSIKIVSDMTQSSSGCVLTYNGTENEPLTLKYKKETSSSFTFVAGDTLIFIGYDDSITTAFQDAPTNSQFYTFNFPSTGVSCPGMPAVTYMGQTYNTVQIGTQCWFRENLNAGTRISGSQNQTNNGIIEKYCYNDSIANCTVYGGLYQWDEMMQYGTTQGVQGICPTDWHIPTDAEWTTLTEYLGGGSIAGGKMKEVGIAHWAAPNTGATNSSGFTALPGGYRDEDNNFYKLTQDAAFWSSLQKDSTFAWDRFLYNNLESVLRFGDLKTGGFSVRCVKN
jgi:uncharacterized protein (TIGR02145 family)